MDFGKRLAEERKRLGFNQTEFGKIGAVSKTSQINYESSERSPSVDYWQAISAIGADVNYILTGERVSKAEVKIDKEVEAFLNLYKGMDKKQKELARTLLENQKFQLMAA